MSGKTGIGIDRFLRPSGVLLIVDVNSSLVVHSVAGDGMSNRIPYHLMKNDKAIADIFYQYFT